jgi:guanylate kinase
VNSTRSSAHPIARRGTLFVISGPSGVGKGSVVQRLLARDPEGLGYSVSYSTRPPRPNERPDRDYVFVTPDRFEDMAVGGEFLEWAEVFGHRYGTAAEPVERMLAEGRDVVLEIDVQGARQVRERTPDAVLIFLAPPTTEELERRLRSRGTEDDAKLARRLEKAAWEMQQRTWFDHVVVNDDLEEATAQVEAIIQGSRTPTGGPTHP